jgi:hypothetical protein
MSQTQHNANTDNSTGTQPVTTTDDIWAIKREDGHITLRLADYTPPNGYAELESTFTEHLTDLRDTLEYGRGPTTVGTATVTQTTHNTEITNIEMNLNGAL